MSQNSSMLKCNYQLSPSGWFTEDATELDNPYHVLQTPIGQRVKQVWNPEVQAQHLEGSVVARGSTSVAVDEEWLCLARGSASSAVKEMFWHLAQQKSDSSPEKAILVLTNIARVISNIKGEEGPVSLGEEARLKYHLKGDAILRNIARPHVIVLDELV